MILLSEHSYERCKERVNIHGSKALIRAEKAYYLGKDIEAFDKVLSKYLANVLKASDGDLITQSKKVLKTLWQL